MIHRYINTKKEYKHSVHWGTPVKIAQFEFLVITNKNIVVFKLF